MEANASSASRGLPRSEDYSEHDLQRPAAEEARAWDCRQDPFSSYRAGFELRTYRTCRRVLMFHRLAELGPAPVLVRSTDLTYTTSDAGDPRRPALTLLSSALALAHSPLGIGGDVQIADAASTENVTGRFSGSDERWIDLDGEGLPGVLSVDDRPGTTSATSAPGIPRAAHRARALSRWRRSAASRCWRRRRRSR